MQYYCCYRVFALTIFLTRTWNIYSKRKDTDLIYKENSSKERFQKVYFKLYINSLIKMKDMNNIIKSPFIMRKVAVIALCVVWMFNLSGNLLYAQEDENTAWDYPVKPGMDEWRYMPYAEKVEKSQPPKELLDSWDTETLFKYCVDYPLNKVTLMYNNRNEGFKRVYDQSAVWQAFIQREDALDSFVKYFESRPYNRLLAMNDIEIRNNELFNLFFLEKLVSETDFAINIDSSGKRKLANTIMQSHQSKKKYPDELFGVPYNSSLSALIKILESDKAISPNDEISLRKFREETGNEAYIGSNMELAIISKVFNYIHE